MDETIRKQSQLLTWIKNNSPVPGLTASSPTRIACCTMWGEGHPKCPERLIAIRDQLMASQLYDELHEIEAPEVTDQQLAPCIRRTTWNRWKPHAGQRHLHRVDPDTAMMAHTLRAGGGRRGQGSGHGARRPGPQRLLQHPPAGHHAESAKSMGFCFTTTWPSPPHALSQHGLERGHHRL